MDEMKYGEINGISSIQHICSVRELIFFFFNIIIYAMNKIPLNAKGNGNQEINMRR